MRNIVFVVLFVLLMALVGCGGSSSSSSSGHWPTKEICQACTINEDCKSGNCRQFKSGIWRCVPPNVAPNYTCPAGMYKLPSGDEEIMIGG